MQAFDTFNMIRIGHGFDVHRLVPGRRLILCGVELPHRLGLDGHSDADVAVHAAMDAILGALALGDIGHWFPVDDDTFLNADSLELMRRIMAAPQLRDWQIGNLDITILAQCPRLAPHIERMRANVANAGHCSVDRISVKATTTEKLGFCGREEGIAAEAVGLLYHL